MTNRRKTGNRAVLLVGALLVGSLLLAGCGGSGGTSTSASAGNAPGAHGGSSSASGGASSGGASSASSGGVDQTFGALTSRVVGTAQTPVVFYGSGGAVTGIAGASVTSLIQNRTITAPTLDANTKLAYNVVDSTGYWQLFTMPTGGGTPTQITAGNQGKYYPAWSPDGTKLAYYSADSTGTNQLFTVPSGGGTPTQITTGNQGKYYPAWSPDGTRIAYNAADSTGTKQLFTVPSGGGTPTQITFGNQYKFNPAFSPDGTRIAYSAQDSNSVYQLFTVPSGGGTPTQITTDNDNIGKAFPAFSPDGTKIAYSARDSAGTLQLFTVPSGGGTPTQVTTGNQDKDYPTWSPDGAKLVYSANDSTGYYQLFSIPSGGGTPTQIAFGNQHKLNPAWSPFLTSPKAVTLIGSAGLLGSSAAGFLFAQNGDDIKSVLTFDTAAATTASRAGGRVDALTAPDAVSPTNLIFSLTATDSLSSLKFVNYDSASAPGKVTAVSLPAGTTGALVSFNAATGKVTTVLPYAANRHASAGASASSSTPQVSQQGNALVLHGRFLAVYDGAGENRAPAQGGGASTVLLDAQTGQITAVL
jgi:hypothetical protein